MPLALNHISYSSLCGPIQSNAIQTGRNEDMNKAHDSAWQSSAMQKRCSGNNEHTKSAFTPFFSFPTLDYAPRFLLSSVAFARRTALVPIFL